MFIVTTDAEFKIVTIYHHRHQHNHEAKILVHAPLAPQRNRPQ